jgi:catechol 2,3-dioxygenase-like lactoylglutathione lyase family enzyme
MPATSLFHIAIKTARPEVSKRFYEQVLGMSESPRPKFEFPGYWMQLNTPHGGSILHIYTGNAALRNDGTVPSGSGAIDHIALAAHGFALMRERCRTLHIPYRERVVPGFPLWQLFCYDPNGIQLELNFHSDHEAQQGVEVDPDNWVRAGLEWFEPDAYTQFEGEVA